MPFQSIRRSKTPNTRRFISSQWLVNEKPIKRTHFFYVKKIHQKLDFFHFLRLLHYFDKMESNCLKKTTLSPFTSFNFSLFDLFHYETATKKIPIYFQKHRLCNDVTPAKDRSDLLVIPLHTILIQGSQTFTGRYCYYCHCCCCGFYQTCFGQAIFVLFYHLCLFPTLSHLSALFFVSFQFQCFPIA